MSNADALSSHTLTPARTVLLAITSGLAVASMYYCQPLLGLLMSQLNVSSEQVGYLPTVTQLGYACGMLLLTPLGDCVDRRGLITVKGVLLSGALLITAFADSISMLYMTSLAIGLLATLAQDMIPTTAALSEPDQRGKNVGKVLAGLLIGVLLSRVASGFLAEWLGWQSIFLIAAVCMVCITFMLRAVLPVFQPMVTLPYHELIFSLFRLLFRSRVLQRAALAQGLLGVAFSAFWSTLAVMLYQAPFHLGSTAAGLFGIAGAIGAFMAPLFGKYADQLGARKVTLFGTSLVAISFLIMLLMNFTGATVPEQLAVMVVMTVLFDIGVQATFIAHQTLIYQVDPSALSRLNAVLVVSVFIGMSLGGFIASHGYASYGWVAVTALATVAGIASFVVRLTAD
ncbi:MFS transporter [Tolumonas osonensis]|uniref:Putative MFS family arabinose efflux permease n=1 Tax=Tolumonas osonensis TaxID=675874 RepID=A0A841G9X3_9GAMM|nr:MFS transporter [Tolumonas osonensis]MBB6054739.1 putative MFS family arabinose efflux permease [Tolumonas osonensis]